MQKVLSWSTRDWIICLGLVVLWALLYIPNLRTSPNWYGDEGIVLEEAWTLAQGHPRYGAMKFDFLSPNPHPPIYLLLLGTSLKIFGNDIVVGRALQILTGLATAFISVWVGGRLISRNFGYLCAVAFLCYPEVVFHYRWTRGHPMLGMWALACVGFMICYVQEKKLHHIVWAGIMCSLGMGCHFFGFPLIGAVVATAFFVNKRHIFAAGAASVSFVVVFLLWFAFAYGLDGLVAQFNAAFRHGFKDTESTVLSDILRMYRGIMEFIFLTPTIYFPKGTIGVDFWLTTAFLGAVFFPVKRFRKWIVFWLLALMLGVFSGRNTVGTFLYQAFSFIPLLAICFAGAMVQLGDVLAKFVPSSREVWRFVPALIIIGSLGISSLYGSLGHLQTKIDRWSVVSWKDAAAAMDFVNSHTKPQDYVIMTDQLFWLYKHERKAQLIHAAFFDLGIQENVAVGVGKEKYWFDPSLKYAKYLVLAAGSDAAGQASGVDAIFWSGYKGPRILIERVQQEQWPIVFRQGDYIVLENPNLVFGPPDLP